MQTKYLVQAHINREQWVTIAKRGSFQSAKAKANSEFKAMKGAHETAIIREDDLDAPMLRRLRSNNFEL